MDREPGGRCPASRSAYGATVALNGAEDVDHLAVGIVGRPQVHLEYQRLVEGDDPLARYALEPVAKLDAEREARTQAIADSEARLAEWTAEVNANAVLDFYNAVVDVVKGRVTSAAGVAEVNQALRDVLTGVWLSFDGKTLRAEAFRYPLQQWPEAIEDQRRQLPNTPPSWV